MREQEPQREPQLPSEQDLEALYDADQNAMQASDITAIHEHTESARSLIAQHGWIDTKNMNSKAKKGLWLTVLHSDHDVDFQKQALAQLQSAVESGSVPKYQLAYLTDRVRRNTSEPQLFGVYPWTINEENKLVPAPIDDEKNIEQRWKEYDLARHLGTPSFADHRERTKEEYEAFLKKHNRLPGRTN